LAFAATVYAAEEPADVEEYGAEDGAEVGIHAYQIIIFSVLLFVEY
jgi:hypothetical protein